MNFFDQNNDDVLFGRSVEDYLNFEGDFFTEKAIHDFDDQYIVEVSVPGFRPYELQLTVDKNQLVLQGFEIKYEQRFLYTKTHKQAIFQRTLLMPIDVASNTITAKYKPGLLQIFCPKQLIPNTFQRHFLVQYRKIKIKAAKDWTDLRWIDKISIFFNRLLGRNSK